MSIKPLDMQVIVPKMTEVARMHGSDAERSQIAAQQSAASSRHMVEASLREVHAQKSVQKVTVHAKRDDESERDARRGKKKKQSKDANTRNGGGDDGRFGVGTGEGRDIGSNYGDGVGHIDIKL